MRQAAFIGLTAALMASAALATDAAPSQERPLYETDPAAIVTNAKDAGVRRCEAAIGKLSDAIFRNGTTKQLRRNNAWSTWHRTTPDDRLFASQVVLQFADGSPISAVTAVPAPRAEDGCDITYTTTYAEPKTCSIIREKDFKDLPFIGDMNGDTVVLGKEGETFRVLLAPSGESRESCLVVRTETLYGIK